MRKPTTPQQRLAKVVKRARDIMRTDPGLNGDLDRIPQLAWLLFLKAFDDLEEQRATLDLHYAGVLPEEYRWALWAKDQRLTGDKLIHFVNDKLLPALRSLSTTEHDHSLADVIRDVFSGVENRMRSGYQLRELLDVLSTVHFTSSDDIHTMAFLYESILKEVRDSAGDSGEFYTPRPVIRFIVKQVSPTLGDIVLDPACGTCGFLVETLEHLRPTAKSVHDKNRLERSLRGFEKKPQSYLLGVMNLVLHEVDVPRITLGNSLSTLQQDKSTASQVDVIMTNPPFGGAESRDVIDVFPRQLQTAETAWLFLSTVIDKLKFNGRSGIVLPNGVLFDDDGPAARIRQRLLAECNLHTIVRLPGGVFAPYTDIPTNILFFDKGEPTKEIWYYEISPPTGRKKYTKTAPLLYEAFRECQDWWGGRDRAGREGTSNAWRVTFDEIRERDYNLDIRNPARANDLAYQSPNVLLRELCEIEHEILDIVRELQEYIAKEA